MAKSVLYSFRRCPYAMRARMGLWIAEIELEHREIILRDKPAHMLEISPKGTVPVLQLADGSVLEQSIDILRWALSRNDPEGWLAGDDADLIAANDGAFKDHLDRYKYAGRYEGADALEHRAQAAALLQPLEQRLARQAFLSGPSRSLADIAIFPFVRQFANTDRAWFDTQPMPALQAWLSGLLQSDLFAAIMVKHDLWQEPTA